MSIPTPWDMTTSRFSSSGTESEQLAFLPGGEAELQEFLRILAGIGQGRSTDLLATLWHRGFEFIRMEYVDVSEGSSGCPGVETDRVMTNL